MLIARLREFLLFAIIIKKKGKRYISSYARASVYNVCNRTTHERIISEEKKKERIYLVLRVG